MKTIACVDPGIIVQGTLLKSGKISEKDRKDVTNDCVVATMQHISCMKDFVEIGAAGYEWTKKDTGSKIQLLLIDNDKYTVSEVPNGSKSKEVE